MIVLIEGHLTKVFLIEVKYTYETKVNQGA